MNGPDEQAEHHAFRIAGGPYGPIGGTHVFPRSFAIGNLLAQLLEATGSEASPYIFSNVNVDPGKYYRGSNEVVLPADLPLKLREGIRKADTWSGLRKGLRALRDRSRLDDYIENNPEKIKQSKREAREWDYLNNNFVAVDFEGQDYLGNVIYLPNGTDRPTPYDDHRLFMGGAASIDKNKPPEWLINPDSTDSDKKPLDPRALLEWLVALPEKFGPDAIYVMYSFSYDVTHILRHLRFEKAWEIFKEEKYDLVRSKRRKINSRTFCGDPFNEFVMKYRNRKQLDIWKLRDPKQPWLRDENGNYVLSKDGHKIMDHVAHVTLFDTHPFFQQSFAKAAEFLVKIGKADQADFDFMKDMKGRRDRFSTEPLESIKEYTELELRYLAQVITELRQILHDIRLDCAPDMKPIHISNWYGPGAIAVTPSIHPVGARVAG
jgi:hypothetical protein